MTESGRSAAGSPMPGKGKAARPQAVPPPPREVRAGQKAGDYGDPGWYPHPPGTNAFEWTNALADPARFAAEGGMSMPARGKPAREIEVQIRRPTGHLEH